MHYNALNSLQEKATQEVCLDVKGEKLESSFAELGANISNKEFILSRPRNLLQKYAFEKW